MIATAYLKSDYWSFVHQRFDLSLIVIIMYLKVFLVLKVFMHLVL